MKTLKPFKVTASGPLYKVKTLAKVDLKLADSVEWRKEHRLLSFDFKPVRLPAKPVNPGLSRKYSWRLASYSPGVGIKSALPPCPAAGITSRPPASLAEHRKGIGLSFKTYIKQWGKLVPRNVHDTSREYIKTYPPKLTTLLLFKGKKMCGICSHIKTTGVMKDKQNYVSWYYLFPGLTPAERRSARYQVSAWLKKTTRRKVSTLVEGFERDAFEFFSALGFITLRIVIERRK